LDETNAWLQAFFAPQCTLALALEKRVFATCCDLRFALSTKHFVNANALWASANRCIRTAFETELP
jgi:hypothetical protein